MAYTELITTERLVLRRWHAPTHTPALAALNALPEAVRFLNAGVPFTPEESAGQSARFAAHWDRYGFGLWAVEVAGACVGFTGLCHPLWFPAYASEVEIGRRLHPSAWGRGFATEAGRLALECGFAELGLERVIACIDPDNRSSIAVADRLGLARGETVPEPSGPGQLVIYSIGAGTSSDKPERATASG
ncbi:RimJ/RimL family protein N-acetyltransferase [Solirubrobacter pauli]|uniref:RimJ/RimL family protein N-acetyltransferase n=1 Tax=Solirubrobacter pauli TaxID=166793 RepID=A0A660L167_9ACTN|nr:GNAT family N-acetyltransferase [Solirubrobacter pauli]RKQ87687.1 RimJ/RimL family protein N-acetyltransferase [Solirubrobacter pauli]